MPGYKGHLLGGVAAFGCGLFALQHLNPSAITMSEWLACALAGSLFPDVDTKSKGQGIFYRILLCALILALAKSNMHLFIALSIIGTVPLLVRHRGLFHKIWFIICMPLFAALLVSMKFPDCATIIFIDVTFFIAGAFSHLVLDLGVRRTLRF